MLSAPPRVVSTAFKERPPTASSTSLSWSVNVEAWAQSAWVLASAFFRSVLVIPLRTPSRLSTLVSSSVTLLSSPSTTTLPAVPRSPVAPVSPRGPGGPTGPGGAATSGEPTGRPAYQEVFFHLFGQRTLPLR